MLEIMSGKGASHGSRWILLYENFPNEVSSRSDIKFKRNESSLLYLKQTFQTVMDLLENLQQGFTKNF